MCCPLLFQYFMWRSRLYACFLELAIWFWWTSIKGEPWLYYPGAVYCSGSCVCWCAHQMLSVLNSMISMSIWQYMLFWVHCSDEKCLDESSGECLRLSLGLRLSFYILNRFFYTCNWSVIACLLKKMVTSGPVEVNEGSWQLVTAINGECDSLTLCEWHS